MKEGQDVPHKITQLTVNSNNGWSQRHASHTLGVCIDVFRRQLAQSHTILGTSLPERAQHWQEAIMQKYMQLSRECAKNYTRNFANVIDTGVGATSGVPNDWRTIQAMYQEIKEQEKTLESDAEAQEVSVVVHHQICPIMVRARVQLPSSSSEISKYISLGLPASSGSDDSGMSWTVVRTYCSTCS
jgi:hypothetical protein